MALISRESAAEPMSVDAGPPDGDGSDLPAPDRYDEPVDSEIGRRALVSDRAERLAGAQPVPRRAGSSPLRFDRGSFAERQLFSLEERLADAERRLLERSAGDSLRDLEFKSMQLALDLKDAYIARLETDQGKLHAEIIELTTTRAAIFVELERVRGEVAELGTFAAAVRARRGYRLVDLCAKAVRVPLRLCRRLARKLRH